MTTFQKPRAGRAIWTDGTQALLRFTSAHGEYLGERWVLKRDYLGTPELFEFVYAVGSEHLARPAQSTTFEQFFEELGGTIAAMSPEDRASLRNSLKPKTAE